jgi:hypothetical protein
MDARYVGEGDWWQSLEIREVTRKQQEFDKPEIVGYLLPY